MRSFEVITHNWALSNREAVKSKNYDYLQKYLANEQNIYLRENDGCTLLQVALQADDIETVRFLLQYKADPNQSYLYGHWKNASPLHFTLSSRSNAMTMLLIEYGADIFATTPNSVPIIYTALMHNRVHVIRYLMNNGISPDTLINEKLSLLTYAVMKGNIKIVKCILEHKPDINLYQNQRAIVKATYGSGYHSKRLVKMLYRYGFTLQLTDIHLHLIEAAINNGHYATIENLLKLGVSPNFKTSSNEKNKKAESMLHIAVAAQDLPIVKLLLEYGANIHVRDGKKKSPILIAAELNNLGIIKLLLKYGANVKDVDLYGRTVLHLAIMEYMEYVYKHLNMDMNRSKTKIIMMLVSMGADVNAKKYTTKSSALHFAAWMGIPGVIQVLLAHGARVDEVNSLDMTPLQCAENEMADFIDGVNGVNHQVSFGKLKLMTLALLEHHVYRLHRIGFPVCSRDLEKVNENVHKLDDNVSKLIDDEIEYIKNTRISDGFITLYHFLTSNNKKAGRLIRNEAFLENLIALLRRPDKFPEYAKLIRNKLTSALMSKHLDSDIFRLMNFLFKGNDLPLLPNECVEQIINYLSINDKKLIIDQFTRILV